jgi:hypothetical protein
MIGNNKNKNENKCIYSLNSNQNNNIINPSVLSSHYNNIGRVSDFSLRVKYENDSNKNLHRHQ